MKKLLNKYSRVLTADKSQGASQAMLYGTGLTKTDMEKPQIGIASMWYEGNTCNMHLLDLANTVKQSVQQAELVSRQFNTIGVSDGMSMGTTGMRYSLQSRDLIADSIETVMAAHWYDACVALPGCDKNLPGALIALARLNRPGFIIYGGSIKPGCVKKKEIDIVSAFQSYGEFISHKIDDAERESIVQHACPGAGACGGMYTANTMACAIEALGMSLPYSSSNPAVSAEKMQECQQAGNVIYRLLELDLKPQQIMTHKAFENAMVLITILGGSTNAVLHLLAIAKAANVELTLNDFQTISNKTPLLADLKPSGNYLMADLHAVGGTPAVMKLLLQHGLLHGDCLTVTGKTLEENLKHLPDLDPNQKILFPFTKPIKKTGHIQILTGNLPPEGAVAKITGKEGETFSGSAKVFDSEQAMIQALEANEIAAGDVIVIRYQGPKGGPGMPEMLKPTAAIMGAGLGNVTALITDGRFSGGSHGFIVGHISPEAQLGGPIALIKNGDRIYINAISNQISVDVSIAELAKRKQQWKAPAHKVTTGVLYKYIKQVSSASKGCITDE